MRKRKIGLDPRSQSRRHQRVRISIIIDRSKSGASHSPAPFSCHLFFLFLICISYIWNLLELLWYESLKVKSNPDKWGKVSAGRSGWHAGFIQLHFKAAFLTRVLWASRSSCFGRTQNVLASFVTEAAFQTESWGVTTTQWHMLLSHFLQPSSLLAVSHSCASAPRWADISRWCVVTPPSVRCAFILTINWSSRGAYWSTSFFRLRPRILYFYSGL